MNAQVSQPFIREQIRANPPPDVASVITQAQSILTRNGRIGPRLSREAAELVIECAKKARDEFAEAQDGAA